MTARGHYPSLKVGRIRARHKHFYVVICLYNRGATAAKTAPYLVGNDAKVGGNAENAPVALKAIADGGIGIVARRKGRNGDIANFLAQAQRMLDERALGAKMRYLPRHTPCGVNASTVFLRERGKRGGMVVVRMRNKNGVYLVGGNTARGKSGAKIARRPACVNENGRSAHSDEGTVTLRARIERAEYDIG
jgi:hypothetical protein